MITVFALVILLQKDPQIFEFSIVASSKKVCEQYHEALRERHHNMYEASTCIEMKLPKDGVTHKKGGQLDESHPPSRPTKPVPIT